MSTELPDHKLQQDRLFYYEARRIFGMTDPDPISLKSFTIIAATGEHYATLSFDYLLGSGAQMMMIMRHYPYSAFIAEATKPAVPMRQKLARWSRNLAKLDFPQLDFRVRCQLTVLLAWRPPHAKTLREQPAL